MARSPTDWVLHVDLDEFLAAVEVGRRPELRGRPVVVGGNGDPTERGVVAAASYAAREYGVRSGMPLRTAARRCPEAVFLPSDRPTYEAASEQVMATVRRFGVVEVLGWDEAFVAARTDDPEARARDIQRAVLAATGLSCSVGIGDNRLRAKVATGFAKRMRRQAHPAPERPAANQQAREAPPAGVYRLTAEDWMTVMGDRPTDALWGVGAKTARKLADIGITTVRELASADRDLLVGRFGPTMGPWYRVLALGLGGTSVTDEPHRARSRSREVTFQRNVTSRSDLDDHIVELAQRVAKDVADEGRPAVRVAVKVRFAPFFTQTRSVPLPAPSGDVGDIEAAARTALARFELGRPVRLLGVRADLAPA